MKKIFFSIIGLFAFCAATVAELQTASVFSDHMVIQRGKNVPVWGTGSPGENVSVYFDGQTELTTVGGDGKWRVNLMPMSANAVAQNLVVAGSSNTNTLSNVLIGDVWLASGQSNMRWPLSSCSDKATIMADSNNTQIRYFNVPYVVALEPSDSINATWAVSSDSVVGDYSAISVIFAQEIQPEIGVPVGMILCAYSSLTVEAWVSEAMQAHPAFAPTQAFWDTELAGWPAKKASRLQAKLENHLANPITQACYDIMDLWEWRLWPSGTYNGMLHSLFPFSMKGIIWRQGEANWLRAAQYRDLLPLMIEEWRANFEQPDLPFIQAQLPEQKDPTDVLHTASGADSYIAELRESQFVVAQTMTNVEIVVAIDVNNPTGNIHPSNKQVAGVRLAKMALGNVYNEPITFQGPIYKGMTIDNDKVEISFDYVSAENGLMIGERESLTSLVVSPVPTADITQFALAGEDRVFHSAMATITNGTNIVLQSAQVPTPVAVRYAWCDNPVGRNLYNEGGFPALPFRTDDWPLTTEGVVEPDMGLIFLTYYYGEVLTIEAIGAGTVTKTNNAVDFYESGIYGVYPSGTTVDLLATPDEGEVFAGWVGDADGTETNHAVVMSNNKSVVAYFGELPPPATFNSDPVVERYAVQGNAYHSTLADDASDRDGLSLSFALQSDGPTWLSVASDGTLSGTPGVEAVGLNSWTVEVRNELGRTNTAMLNITVILPDSNADNTYTWNGAAEDGNWSNDVNWVGTAPVDAGTADGLNGNMLVIVDGSNAPSNNTPILQGSSGSVLNDFPMLDFSRGSLQLSVGGDSGVYKDTVGTHRIFNVGNGTDVAKLTLDPVAAELILCRHGSGSLHVAEVHANAELEITKDLWLTYHSSRQGQIWIDDGGSLTVGGAIQYKGATNSFVSLEAGAGMSATYGGDFTSLAAVINAFGTVFRGTGGARLSAVDVGGVGFRITASETLIAYYPLDGNTDDATGSYNLTVSGTVAYDGADLQVGTSSGVFNGSSFGSVGMPDLTSQTYAFWVYPTADGYPLSRDGSSRFEVRLLSGEILIYLNSTATIDTRGTATLDVPLNQWTHVAITLDETAGEVSLYINKILWETVATSRSISGEPLFVGARAYSGGSSPFLGKIDDVRVYDTVLSSSEVAQLPPIATSNAAPDISLAETGVFVEPGAETSLPDATVLDDDFPGNPVSAITWSVTDQPTGSTVTFDATTNNTVTLSDAGNYTLTASVNDGELTNDVSLLLVGRSPGGALQNHWEFETNLTDSVSGIEGQAVTNSYVSSFTNVLGQAIEFDGSLERAVDCGPFGGATTGSLTYAVWLKPSVVNNREAIAKWSTTNPTEGFRLSLRSDTSIRFFVGSSSPIYALAPANSYAVDEWVHLACTIDLANDLVTAYVNGESVASRDLAGKTPGILDSDASLFLGRISYTESYRYSGLMDDVRLYDKALSPAEILQLYADVTGALTGYASWAQDNGLGELNNGYGDDPDEDTMDNLLEFSFGGNPLTNDASAFLPMGSISSTSGTNYLNYVYRRRIQYASDGLSYFVGSTTDLTGGSPTNATEEAGSGAIDATYESVTNQVPVDTEAAQFMQLRVTID